MRYEESLQREFDQNAETISDLKISMDLIAPDDEPRSYEFGPYRVGRFPLSIFAENAARLFFRNLEISEKLVEIMKAKGLA